jgi:hypothetical protein
VCIFLIKKMFLFLILFPNVSRGTELEAGVGMKTPNFNTTMHYDFLYNYVKYLFFSSLNQN